MVKRPMEHSLWLICTISTNHLTHREHCMYFDLSQSDHFWVRHQLPHIGSICLPPWQFSSPCSAGNKNSQKKNKIKTTTYRGKKITWIVIWKGLLFSTLDGIKFRCFHAGLSLGGYLKFWEVGGKLGYFQKIEFLNLFHPLKSMLHISQLTY